MQIITGTLNVPITNLQFWQSRRHVTQLDNWPNIVKIKASEISLGSSQGLLAGVKVPYIDLNGKWNFRALFQAKDVANQEHGLLSELNGKF